MVDDTGNVLRKLSHREDISIGEGANANNSENVAIGKNAETTGGGESVAVGSEIDTSGGNLNTAVGHGATITGGNNGVAIGQGSTGNFEAVAIGSDANASSSSIAIGYGVSAPFGVARIGGNQLVFGGVSGSISDGDLNNSELTLEFDEGNTNFVIRGKDSSGNVQSATVSYQ